MSGPLGEGIRKSNGTTHAERVFRVQAAFAEIGRDTARLSELAEATGLDDSTVSRILTSGVYVGTFVRRERGLYALGLGAADLGFQALAHSTDDDASHSALVELREATGKALVFLYMKAPFRGLGRQCIDMAVGDSDLVELGMTPRDVLNVTRSLRTGASGRTILAYLPMSIQEAVIDGPVPDEAGPGVYRDKNELRESLRAVRDAGYALGYQECMAGWNSIAAPIVWDDSVMGAVLVLKPAEVMPQAPEEFIKATKLAAARLSRLGGGAWPTS
ncbi:IclR family transcriptional regulator [Kitasatospora sp. NPDC001660]